MASDPTQFNGDVQSAISRRLANQQTASNPYSPVNPVTDPGSMAPPSNPTQIQPPTQPQPAIQPPTQAVNRNPILPVDGAPGAGQGPTRTILNPPSLPGQIPGSGPASGPANPLSGGTGNSALDAYLGTDATYQTQLSDLMRQYDQYQAQANLQASQTQASYDSQERSLNDQATQDRLNMLNTAGARGILHSGIYANELGQYNTADQQQMTNLLGGLQNSKDTASLAYNQFIANELASKAQAIQDAAARRAAQLGTY